MQLKDYLSSQGIAFADFGKLVDASEGMIHKIAYGTRQPSLALAARIAAATGDKVRPADMIQTPDGWTIAKRKVRAA